MGQDLRGCHGTQPAVAHSVQCSEIQRPARGFRHLDDVGVGLGHAGRHCPNTRLRHQLHTDLALGSHLHVDSKASVSDCLATPDLA